MLCHDEIAFGILVNLKETHDVRVVHRLQDFYFLQEAIFLLAREETFLYNLNCPFCSSFPVRTEPDFTKRSCTQDFPYKVVVPDVLRRMLEYKLLLAESDVLGS